MKEKANGEKSGFRPRYRREYGEKMLSYFKESDDGEGAIPSFVKFADRIGVPYTALLRFRDENAEFAEIFRECRARRTDLLVDGVLRKKYDASFVKALLSGGVSLEDGDAPSDAGGEDFELTLRVIGGDAEP